VLPDSDFIQSAGTKTAKVPTISIAMCTYNGDRFLREQSESFLNQSRLPDHLVVCDDGSTDGTRSLLLEFARRSPFPVDLRFNTRNLGIARNFEQSLLACTGDFIALCDQDNRWHPQKLQHLSELLEANPQVGYVSSNAELIDDQGQSLHQTLWGVQKLDAETLAELSPAERRDYLVQSNCLNGATMLLRRAHLWKFLAPIPTTWLHDHWIGVVSEILNCTGFTTPDLLTQYRIHSGQMVGIRSRAWFRPRQSPAEKARRFVQQETRYRDLLSHLETKILPVVPEASVWLDVIQRAQQRLAERIEDERLPWWQREWNRMRGQYRRAA
jgi:glycosyltransferase involved in cell wall biosynthesis